MSVIAWTFETAHIFLLFICDISADNQLTSHIVHMTSQLRALTPGTPWQGSGLKKGFCYV